MQCKKNDAEILNLHPNKLIGSYLRDNQFNLIYTEQKRKCSNIAMIIPVHPKGMVI